MFGRVLNTSLRVANKILIYVALGGNECYVYLERGRGFQTEGQKKAEWCRTLFIYLFMYLYIYLCIRTNFELKKEKEVRRDSTLPPPFDQTLTKLLPILFSGLELLASIFRLLSKCVENNHTKETFSSHTFHIQLTFSMASLEAIFLASGRLKNNEL